MPSTEVVPQAHWLLEPDALVDHFKVIRPLGRGGMAEVYLCRDSKLGRKVALKVIRPDALGSPDAIERFLFEARATARFNHPHIVTIYAVGEHQGKPYVALEFLEGQTLRQRLEQERPGVVETMRLGLAIAEALSEAHQHSILHRDLKPENVMLGRDGRLRVVDFGLARVVDAPSDATTTQDVATMDSGSLLESFKSEHGKICGTPPYMAPEQWAGKEVTGATDVWALGVMMFELLGGKRPFDGATPLLIGVQVCSPDAPMRLVESDQLSADLCELVASCLQKDASKRPTANEVVQRLQRMLEPARVAVSGDESPFRGLLPFGEQHRQFFFGRDGEVSEFVERLRTEPIMPVIGASGAGKSSFVQAGVIPRLRERGPLVVLSLRPGRDPFGALAARISSARRQASKPGSSDSPFGSLVEKSTLEGGQPEEATEIERLTQQLKSAPQLLNLALARLAEKRRSSVVLFVDQLEELYTLVDDDQLRQQFMQALTAAADDAASPVRVIVTLREEFLSRLAEGSSVKQAFQQVTVLRSPGREALHEILTRPVQSVGYQYDDDKLVEKMIDEVAGEASCLPLLQFAGQELWQRRDAAKRALRRSVYASMGGVAGALAQHADGVLSGLTPVELNLARSMLLRLVTPEGTRQVLSGCRLVEGLAVDAASVLKRLTSSRLITSKQSEADQEGEVELVHESLIATWSRLRRWIEESREELVFLREMGQAAELWERHGRREDELLRGKALVDAQRAAEHCTSELSERVRKFLGAGAKRAKRSRRIKQLGLIAMVLGPVAFGVTFAAKEREAQQQRAQVEQQSVEIDRQRQQATAQRDLAKTSLAAALVERAFATHEPHEALVYLASSLVQAESAEGRGLLSEVIASPRPRLRWQTRPGVLCVDLAFSPDGKQLACAEMVDRVVIWDVATGAEIGRLGYRREGTRAINYATDGSVIASLSIRGYVQVWDAVERRELARVEAHTGAAQAARLSPDGKKIVIGDSTGAATLVDWRTGAELARVERVCERVNDFSFSPDAEQVLVVCADKTTIAWRPGQASQLEKITAPGTKATIAAFSRNGKLILFLGEDGALVAVDSETRAERWRAKVHREEFNTLDFSVDGRLIATTGMDGTVALLDAADGSRRAVFRVASSGWSSCALSPDSQLLASASALGELRIWHLPTGRTIRRFGGVPLLPEAVGLSANGATLYSVDMFGAIYSWDVETGIGEPRYRIPGIMPANEGMSLAVFADPERLAIGTWGGDIHLVDLRQGVSSRILVGHRAPVFNLTVARDQRTLFSASEDGSVREWDVETGVQRRIIAQFKPGFYGLALSPDEKLLVATGADRAIRIWSMPDAKQVAALESAAQGRDKATFDASGESLAVATRSGSIEIWDTASWTLRNSLPAHRTMISGLAFSPDGRRLGTTSYDGTATLWQVATARQLARLVIGDEAHTAQFTADGTGFLVSTTDRTIRRWDLAPLDMSTDVAVTSSKIAVLANLRQQNAALVIDDRGDMTTWDLATRQRKAISHIDLRQSSPMKFSDDGSRLLARAGQRVLVEFDVARGAELWRSNDIGRVFIVGAASDPQNRRVAVADRESRALIWDLATRAPAAPLVVKELFYPFAVDFSPDGRRLAVATGDGLVLVDPLTGEKTAIAAGLYPQMDFVTYASDGTLIATGQADGTIRLWDARTLTGKGFMRGPATGVQQILFAPDNQQLFVVSKDRTISIWAVSSGRELARIRGSSLSATPYLAVSSDGRWLFGRASDQSLRFWDLSALTLDANDLLDRATRETGLTVQNANLVVDEKRFATALEEVVEPSAVPTNSK